MFHHVASGIVQHEVARGVDRRSLGALERQPVRRRVGTGLDDEVVLQLPLVAVVDDIDAGVDIQILNPTVVGDVGVPLRRVVAEEVVARAGLFVPPGNLGRRVGGSCAGGIVDFASWKNLLHRLGLRLNKKSMLPALIPSAGARPQGR